MKDMLDLHSLNVYPASSRQEGGCNACTSHMRSNGMQEHRVWVIQMLKITSRVCDDCRRELITQLERK